MIKRNKLIIFILLFSLQFLHAENTDNKNKFLDVFLSASEVFYINLGVTTANNLITGYEWSYFLPEIIKENFTLPPIWDYSSFTRNQLAHPYFGSLYFNAARTSDLNFFESFLFTAAGSVMYETLIERGNISINDLITTSFAGSLTGEMLFRLGNEVCSKNLPCSFIINPVSFINYLIRKDTISCPYADTLNHSYSWSTLYDLNNKTALTGIALKVKYNDVYNADTIKPLDQFFLRLNVLGGKEGFSYDYSLEGPLFSRHFNNHTAGICAIYEADKKIDSDFSNSSAGLFYSYSKDVNKFALSYNCKLNYTMLGTCLPCKYGHGPSLNTFFELDFKKSGKFSADYNLFFLFPYDGSYTAFQKLSVDYEIIFCKYFFINAQTIFVFNENTNCYLTFELGACFD